MSEVRFRLGEVAARAGVTRDTVRFYERSGLLEAPVRATGRHRTYGFDTIERVRFVRQLQTCGLTIGDIRELLVLMRQDGGAVSKRLLQILTRRAAFIDQRVAQLQRCLDRLSEAIRLSGRPKATLSTVMQSLPAQKTATPFRFGRA